MAANKPKAYLFLAAAATAVMAAFLGWAFLGPGTLGMYRWGYVIPILGLAAAGLLPIPVAAAAALIGSRKAEPPRLAIGISSAVSILSLLLGLGVSAYVLSNAYGTRAMDWKPALVDPAKGFPIRKAEDGQAAVRVAMSSDPHYGRAASNAEARSAILRLSQSEFDQGRLDAFFDLGDTVEMGMEADDWKEALGSIKADAPTLPFIALLGNHDAIVGGAYRWRAAFAAGSGPRGTPPGGLSASSWKMDSGPVHFIALDLLWGPEGFGAKEKAWLADALASIPKDEFAVVMSHCFFRSSGYVDEGTGKPWYDHEGLLKEVAPLLAGKADLVVSGHNHYMEWIEADGTAWAVVGAMGGKPDPEPSYKAPGSVWLSRGVFGRLVLETAPDGLRCEFQDQAGRALFARTLAR